MNLWVYRRNRPSSTEPSMMHSHDSTVTRTGQTLALEVANYVFMRDFVCNLQPHCQTQLKPTHWTFKKTYYYNYLL